jgi:Tfp pilus assembly protein PilN
MTEAVSEMVAKYRATLIEMDANRIEVGGIPERWNRLVNRLQALQLKLRETPDGQASITELIDDENATVRAWSATFALAWEPRRAVAALEALAESNEGLTSFYARVTLSEYRKGRLRTDWDPKDRGQRKV